MRTVTIKAAAPIMASNRKISQKDFISKAKELQGFLPLKDDEAKVLYRKVRRYIPKHQPKRGRPFKQQ